MTPGPAAAGAAWIAANTAGYWQFRRALGNPGATQRRVLKDYLRANQDTEFGRRHGFSTIRTAEDYQARVPLASYADVAGAIDRISQGDARILTRDPVERLAPSSGSVTAAKRIPYTARLRREFRRAIAPWIVDLYARQPRAALGRAYWSVTPVAAAPAVAPGKVPVGFEEDSEYVGGLAKRLVDAMLAVPGAVRFIPDVETFRYVTLLALVRHHDLTLVSVWHPSFLTLLLDTLPAHWPALVDDVRRGTVSVPGGLPRVVERAMVRSPLPARADALARLAPDDYRRIWPRLAVVSCWADGHAALYADEVRRRLPGVWIQPKGLLATEGVVTLPFREQTPVAIRSHFFEFLHEGRAVLTHQLEPGRVYSVVLTTGGGLYRYRLDDRVEVNGFVGRTPSLRFLGKDDCISDLCGEKLNETFVAGVLARAMAALGLAPRYAFLAPRPEAGPPCYALFIDIDADVTPALAAHVDDRLADNPHYRYCRDLGQLGPLEVVRVRSMYPRYVERCRAAGQRLGEIKPLALSPLGGWVDVLGDRS